MYIIPQWLMITIFIMIFAWYSKVLQSIIKCLQNIMVLLFYVCLSFKCLEYMVYYHGIIILGGKKNQFCISVYVVASHVPWCFSQAVDGLNSQLNLMRSQSDNVYTEASALFFQQAGKADWVLFHTFLTLWKKTKSTLFCFADIESTVLDNKKYIEETNEMMDSSSKKIAKIISDISAIHKGKNKLYNYFFF